MQWGKAPRTKHKGAAKEGEGGGGGEGGGRGGGGPGGLRACVLRGARVTALGGAPGGAPGVPRLSVCPPVRPNTTLLASYRGGPAHGCLAPPAAPTFHAHPRPRLVTRAGRLRGGCNAGDAQAAHAFDMRLHRNHVFRDFFPPPSVTPHSPRRHRHRRTSATGQASALGVGGERVRVVAGGWWQLHGAKATTGFAHGCDAVPRRAPSRRRSLGSHASVARGRRFAGGLGGSTDLTGMQQRPQVVSRDRRQLLDPSCHLPNLLPSTMTRERRTTTAAFQFTGRRRGVVCFA